PEIHIAAARLVSTYQLVTVGSHPRLSYFAAARLRVVRKVTALRLAQDRQRGSTAGPRACPNLQWHTLLNTFGVSTHLTVAVDVLAEVFFEGFEQRELQLLDFVELRFEPIDSIFERGGAGLLIGNLTLL